jgi:methyltransferase family protein
MRLMSAVGKSAAYIARPFRVLFRDRFLSFKYRQNAFPGTFDWQWEKTNFNRIALVNLLLAKKNGASYLEIGCNTNDLFDSVPCSHKVGVDPASGGTVRLTSDAFFAANRQQFDFVFIDGLHTYDQVRRDVINSIKFLKPGGYVALHDMLPGSWREHHVPRLSEAWTGDVWKVAFELARSKGIDFKIVKIDHGVGVFRLTESGATLADLTKELQEAEFEYFYRNIQQLPLIEWSEFLAWAG